MNSFDPADQRLHFETRAIHQGIKNTGFEGRSLPPIFQSTAHIHDTVDSLSQTFAGQTQNHIYMRLTNPTNRCLEEKLADLESGKAAIRYGRIEPCCPKMARYGFFL